MRLFLVRHGQSRANVDWDENRRVADHAIELTDAGHEQAKAAGDFLGKYLCQDLNTLGACRLWHSPYTRTRQTAARIDETARLPREMKVGRYRPSWTPEQTRHAGDSVFWDKREHVLLAEQQFGLFDGLTDEERAKKYPEETAYYEKCKARKGKFWPKLPLGESRFEVAQRVHQAFGTFHRDVNKHGIHDLVIVVHGTVLRAFVMMWLHKPYEWMHEEPNPRNCAVRLIEDGEDRGYIFEGFKGGQHEGQ